MVGIVHSLAEYSVCTVSNGSVDLVGGQQIRLNFRFLFCGAFSCPTVLSHNAVSSLSHTTPGDPFGALLTRISPHTHIGRPVEIGLLLATCHLVPKFVRQGPSLCSLNYSHTNQLC